MTWQQLNFGTSVNSGTGDDLHSAFSKIDNNLNLLHDGAITTISSAGTGVAVTTTPGVDPTTIILKSLKVSGDLDISTDSDSITISSTLSPIESLSNDLTPTLGGALQVSGHPIQNLNTNTGLFDAISINNLTISEEGGDTVVKSTSNLRLSSTSGTISFGTDVFSSNNITCSTLNGVTSGLHVGNVNGDVVGNVTGNTNGIHTGDVVGNVSGTAGTISNHNLNELSDVASTLPNSSDILSFTGVQYEPKNFNTVVQDSGMAFKMPKFTTSQRDLLTPENGDVIYNTDTNKFQGYENGSWVNLI